MVFKLIAPCMASLDTDRNKTHAHNALSPYSHQNLCPFQSYTPKFGQTVHSQSSLARKKSSRKHNKDAN